MSDPRYAAEFLSDAGFASQETKREKLATIIRALDEADRLRAENERLLQLLCESRTHLMQGDHSEWRKRVEAALAAKGET